jgi:hypothetical protein
VKDARLRIDPGANAGLEHFHQRTDDVIDENDLGLVEGLELEKQHAGLNCERHQKQEIVARERGAVRIPEMRADNQRYHRAAEQARPSLLHAEANKLIGEGGCRPLRCPTTQAGLSGNEADQRRPQGRGA